MEETKRDKFVRIAENRTNRIIDTLQLMENLANTSNYEYTQKDIDKIFNAIQQQLNETKRAFSKQNGTEKKKFKLE